MILLSLGVFLGDKRPYVSHKWRDKTMAGIRFLLLLIVASYIGVLYMIGYIAYGICTVCGFTDNWALFFSLGVVAIVTTLAIVSLFRQKNQKEDK